jgi:hypothetical protein
LEQKVKDATDWRVQFQNRPWVFIGAALGAGALLSAALGGRRSRAAPIGRTYENAGSTPSPTRWDSASPALAEWHRIKSGLISAAGAQVSNLLGQLVPGFREHVSSGSDEGNHSVPPGTEDPNKSNGHGQVVQ